MYLCLYVLFCFLTYMFFPLYFTKYQNNIWLRFDFISFYFLAFNTNLCHIYTWMCTYVYYILCIAMVLIFVVLLYIQNHKNIYIFVIKYCNWQGQTGNFYQINWATFWFVIFLQFF